MRSFDDLEALYGPATSHPEHHRGDHIRYHLAGEEDEFTGTIIWVCTPAPVRGLHLCYVVEIDVRGGMPDIVFPSDIFTRE